MFQSQVRQEALPSRAVVHRSRQTDLHPVLRIMGDKWEEGETVGIQAEKDGRYSGNFADTEGETKMTKTVAITITHGMIVRNILRTDILKILKSDEDTKIVLVVMSMFKFYEEVAAEFSDENVTVVKWPYRINPVEWLLRTMADVIFFNAVRNETSEIKEMSMKKKNYPKYLWLRLARAVLGKDKKIIIALERLDTLLFQYKRKKHWDTFGEDKPNLVFSTDFLCTNEWSLIKAAQHHDVPVMTLIASWDHLSKGRLPTKFDKVIAWNDFLKGQLIEYYGYKPDEIFVSGIPQFDYYTQDKDMMKSRSEFLEGIGGSYV